MKLMLYKWGGFNEDLLKDKLIEAGYEVCICEKECKDHTRDMNLAFELMQAVYREKVDAIISFDYFPVISLACDTCKILYYSWIYDSPMTTVYAKAAKLSCNRIGVFDRDLANRFNERGISTVFYTPLATDTEELEKRMRSTQKGFGNLKNGGACDVSFVGSLYTDHNNYYDIFKDEDISVKNHNNSVVYDNLWSRLDEIISRQKFCYDKDYLSECDFSLDYLNEKMIDHGLCLDEDFDAPFEEIIVADVLEKKVTVEERQSLMSAVAAKCDGKYLFNLYTTSDTGYDSLVNKCNRGKIDYQSEMPKVFKNSKINLHISLRSIHSGIPQRALDIPSCGGFLLANDCEELREYFKVGEEVETYSSLEECMDKIEYYLMNDEIRCKVAERGYEKAGRDFSYGKGLKCLLRK